MTSSAGRKRKTLARTPLSKVVQAEIGAAKRPVKSAQRTDAFIRRGMHPLDAYAASRHSRKPSRKSAP